MLTSDRMIGISDAKNSLSSLAREIESGDRGPTYLLRQNRPVAVLLAVDTFERLEKFESDIEHFEDALSIAKAGEVNNENTYTLDEIIEKFAIHVED